MPSPADPVEPYGATVDDIRALLPSLPITPTSKPNEDAARTFLVMTSSRVAARIGDLAHYPGVEVDKVNAGLAGIAAMGAAGLTENSAHTERAGKGSSAYGDWLWTEFLKAIDEMLEALQKPTAEGGGVVELAGARPAYSLPDPTFWRDTAF